MPWIGRKNTTHIIALLAVFAALTSFSLTGTKSLPTVISFLGWEDGLSGLAYHLPEQAGEPAIFTKTDDSDYSIFRFAHHRFLDILWPVGSGIDSCFSRFQSHSPEFFFDNKSTILIKLRI